MGSQPRFFSTHARLSMRRLARRLLSAGLLSAGLLSAAYAQPIGFTRYESPDGAWVAAFTGAPNGHIVAATGSVGAYRSADRGRTWVPVEAGIEEQQLFSAYTAPNGHLYVAGYSVYRSTDNGATWTSLGSPNPCCWIDALVMGERGELYAGGQGGIGYLPAGSTVWSAIPLPVSAGVTGLVITPAGSLFAVFDENQGLFKIDAATGAATDVVLAPHDPVAGRITRTSRGALLVLAQGGLTYRSTDHGATWTPHSSLYRPTFHHQLLPLAGDTVYAYQENHFLRSVDDGVSWQPLSAPSLLSVNALWAHPDGTLLVSSLASGVYRLPRGTLAWEEANTGLGHGLLGAFAEARDGRYLLSMNAGLYTSEDRGKTWERHPDVPGGISVFLQRRGGALLGASGRTLYASVDNGASWRARFSLSSPVTWLFEAPQGTLFALTYSGLVRSADDGRSWQSTSLQDKWIVGLAEQSGTLFAAAFSPSNLYRSDDQGHTWTLVPGLPDGSTSLVATPRGSLLARALNLISRSVDGGATWTATLDNGPGYEALQLLEQGPDGTLLVGSTRGIYRSTDDGVTWEWTGSIEPFSNNLYDLDVTRGGYLHVTAGSKGLFRSAQPLARPGRAVPAQPAAGAVDLPTTLPFAWHPDPAADSYRFQLAEGSRFTPLLADRTALADTLLPLVLPHRGAYFWRVQAVNALGAGEWSEPRRFNTIPEPPPAPVLRLPEEEAARRALPLALAWEAAAGATAYELQLDTLETFPAPLIRRTVATDTLLVRSGLAGYTTYAWRVRGFNTGGAGAWSSFRRFRTAVAPPALLSPTDSAPLPFPEVTLRWQPARGAARYHLQLAADTTFAHPLLDEPALAALTYTTAALPREVPLYWRLSATTADGETSGWSAPRAFTVALRPVVLDGPPPEATAQPIDPLLRWHPVPQATSYRLQIDPSAAFTGPLAVEGADTSWQATGLDHARRYHWRVQVRYATGEGPWSTPRTFTTVVAAPRPSAPADGALDVGSRPEARWEAVAGATGYTLQLAGEPTFGAPVLERETADTTAALGLLAYNTMYYWRVRARDGDGVHYGAWSAPSYFVVATGVGAEEEALPAAYALLPNYPNPFNPQTTFAFELPEVARVALTVYDVHGRLVATLLDGERPAGRHTLAWNAAALPSGTYFYHLSAGPHRFTRALTLVK